MGVLWILFLFGDWQFVFVVSVVYENDDLVDQWLDFCCELFYEEFCNVEFDVVEVEVIDFEYFQKKVENYCDGLIFW